MLRMGRRLWCILQVLITCSVISTRLTYPCLLCELLYQCVLLFFHTAPANRWHVCRAPGNIFDYVYNTPRIRYAYSPFLRDTGTVRLRCMPLLFSTLTDSSQYGFTLPREWIRPVGRETGGILAYIAKFIATKRGIEL